MNPFPVGDPLHAEYERQRAAQLGLTLDTFRRWLFLDDDAPVLVTAATVAANNAEGDPLWLLIVGPPSSGKTEALQGIAGLKYVHGAATVTPASLLSGTSPKERARNATGGLLRQIGSYGILLCKDFTSVLSQNRDTAHEALAALREIFDGNWDRPVGSAGGQVLSWAGKCGLVGGVTPSIDKYRDVVGALGDRYILLRLPDVKPEEQATAALSQGGNQKQMRADLAEAMVRLIDDADLSRVARPLEPDEVTKLVALATFTARARTAVERNSYTNEVQVLPQPEGPARIVGQFRRLMGGLEAIGADEKTVWTILRRVAIDCVPAIRTKVMQTLMAAGGPMGTGDVAKTLGVDWKTAFRHLVDMRLLGLVFMEVEETESFAGKPRYFWESTLWIDEHFPADVPFVPERTLEETNHRRGSGLSNGKDDHVNGQTLPGGALVSSKGVTWEESDLWAFGTEEPPDQAVVIV